MLRGVDSAARFSAGAAKAAGYSVGARYINQSFNANELADYRANGLILLPIYEESGKPGSYADGQRQGANAKRILDGLGLSGYGCVFTDDVSGAPLSVCEQWARGIRSTFPWHFVYYGPTQIIDALGDMGVIDSGWIEGAFSYSAGWHGGTPTARHACGTQFPRYVTVGGVTCDYNEFTSTPWLPGGPVQTPTTGDWFDMATKQELKDALKELLVSDDDVQWALARSIVGVAAGEDLTGKTRPRVTLNDIGDQLIEPNNGAGPAAEGTARRAIDDVWNKLLT